MAARRSQLQREVLKLYRECLVACRSKPKETKVIVQKEFRKNASIERTDTIMIDYLLRRGKKQLKVLQRSDKITAI
jgi:succinate dehydrogenase assembly factor 1